MNVLMIRAKVHEQSVPDVEAGAHKMFAAIEAAQPKIRYASCKLPDGLSYLVLLQLEDGTTVEVKGNEEIEYDGELHTAANLFDALKEGYYGKF